MRVLKFLVFLTHLVAGFGAIAGGYAAVSEPSGPFGLSTDMLKLGPFQDFFIPGLFLMIVVGAGNLAAAGLYFSRFKSRPYLSGAMGGVMVGWILIQCLVLQSIHWMHVLFFCIGSFQGLVAARALYEIRAFPMDRIAAFLGRRS